MLAGIFQNPVTTEWVRLEGAPVGSLVEPPCSIELHCQYSVQIITLIYLFS